MKNIRLGKFYRDAPKDTPIFSLAMNLEPEEGKGDWLTGALDEALVKMSESMIERVDPKLSVIYIPSSLDIEFGGPDDYQKDDRLIIAAKVNYQDMARVFLTVRAEPVARKGYSPVLTLDIYDTHNNIVKVVESLTEGAILRRRLKFEGEDDKHFAMLCELATLERVRSQGYPETYFDEEAWSRLPGDIPLPKVAK